MSHAIVVQKAMAHDIEEGKCHADARVIAAGLGLYPKLNMRTVLQRISAALIFPLLIVHLKTFDLLKSASKVASGFSVALLHPQKPQADQRVHRRV